MENSFLILGIGIAVLLVLILIILLVKQNKPDLYQRERAKNSNAMGKGIAIGVAIGAGTGVAMGSAMDNPALGIALGVGIGMSIGVALGAAFKKREEEERNTDKRYHTAEKGSSGRLPLIAGIILVLVGVLFLGLMLFLKNK